jgi:hypothetical protein
MIEVSRRHVRLRIHQGSSANASDALRKREFKTKKVRSKQQSTQQQGNDSTHVHDEHCAFYLGLAANLPGFGHSKCDSTFRLGGTFHFDRLFQSRCAHHRPNLIDHT